MNGRGKPRPFIVHLIGGGTQGGGASLVNAALALVSPLARIRNGCPHGCANAPSVARNEPVEFARARTARGPSAVNTVTATRSPGANLAPATTSG